MEDTARGGPPVFKINGVDYVTVDGAAAYLGLEGYEVRNLVNYHRRLEAIKVSTATMITADSLEAEKARRDAESRSGEASR